MAFSSYEDLVNASAKDPDKTMGIVRKAQQARTPVVSRKVMDTQPGQAGAVQRRLRSIQTTAEKDTDRLTEQNKSNGY